jgi:hypothetical protein
MGKLFVPEAAWVQAQGIFWVAQWTSINIGIDASNIGHVASHLNREVTTPTKVGPYTVPVGAIVWPMLYALHNAQHNWEHPEKFCPERWERKSNFFFVGRRKIACLTDFLMRRRFRIFNSPPFAWFQADLHRAFPLFPVLCFRKLNTRLQQIQSYRCLLIDEL